MKICFFANINSKTCRNWISHFLTEDKKEYQVHIVSPYPPGEGMELEGAQLHVVSLYGQRGRSVQDMISATTTRGDRLSATWAQTKVQAYQLAAKLATRWWSQVRMLTLGNRVRRILEEIQPDIVHALRLFQEGEMAGLGKWHPLIISVWGQDLTIDAKLSPLHGWLARNALSQADAVTGDNKRDLELAYEWGRRPETAGELFLSSGGVRSEMFYPGGPDQTALQRIDLDPDALVILSPRGLRPGYIRLNTLFEAIPEVARVYPQVRFVQLEIPNQAIAERYGLSPESLPFIRLLRRTSQDVLAEVMRSSTLMVSPAIKDGTPNSFFECMACGVVPIVPSIAPYPEWIEHGQNGMFFDPYDGHDLAKAIIQALDNPAFLESARETNLKLVNKWASREGAMARVEALYRSVLHDAKSR